MSMMKEFRDFAMRGNVVDMAVGIIIGGAFGTIVKSLVDDVIMPPVGLLLGGVDFTNLFTVLGEGTYETLDAAKEAGAATINYGIFINTAGIGVLEHDLEDAFGDSGFMHGLAPLVATQRAACSMP